MSSLIFYTEAEQVLVATDTLATSLGGEPFMFTTKAFIVPHLQMIMCGTGAGGFLGKWFVRVNDNMVVKDIDHLDYHTPKVLAELWLGHKKEFSLPDDLTTTVYHFGFSQEDGLMHSFVYRSTNDFQSEPRSQYGLGLKPECQVPASYELPTDIKKMMDEQRAIQAARPKNERVFVGGKILIHHLTKFGFNVFTLDKFEDYESDERAIYENFSYQ